MNRLLLLSAALLFLVIFPYTKQIEKFRSDDLTWSLLNSSVSYKEFDPRIFSFVNTYEISDELKQLNNKMITVKGFLKHLKHRDHSDIVLTESVSDVCFMCDHDEHFLYISVHQANGTNTLDTITDDRDVQLKGIFRIEEENGRTEYRLDEAELIAKLGD